MVENIMSVSVVESSTHAMRRVSALRFSQSNKTSSKIQMGDVTVASGMFSISGGTFVIQPNAFAAFCTPAPKW